ncbi:MAG: YfhO family protein [Clostridiales bacterium]|nr:YfhO family protein [Clostridiales bacterium]
MDSRKKYYLAYTILFALMFFSVYIWYLADGRSLIWEKDGLSQHYRALVYYGKYLREIVRTLWNEHRLVIPEWDFLIGQSSDVMMTMHYYVMGDPLALLSVAFPERYTHILFSLLIVFRIYASGIAFSELCFGTGKTNKKAVLTAVLTYTFSYWTLFNLARHPYFLNPPVFFPLIILGIEKVLERKRPYLLIAAVFISAISNFYFFYMIVIITALYVILRLVTKYGKDIATMMKEAFTLLGYCAVAALLAGFMLAPIANIFLNDSRMGFDRPFHLLYDLDYYENIPVMLISARQEFWACMGYSVPAVLAVIILLRRPKRDLLLKLLLAAAAVILLVPAFGQILNGFSYMNNRWCWALLLLVSYILVTVWDDLIALQKKDLIIIIIIMAVYALLLIPKGTSATYETVVLIVITSVLLFVKISENRKFTALLLSTLIGVQIMCVWKISPYGANFVSGSVKNDKQYQTLTDNETKSVKRFADDDYIRYTSLLTSYNAGLTAGISSSSFFWSITNPNEMTFRREIAASETPEFHYRGFDSRMNLLATEAMKYYTVPLNYEGTAGAVPYGMKEIGRDKKNIVFENEYALPIGYTYDSYMTEEDWNKAEPYQREDYILENVLLDKKPSAVPQGSVGSGSLEIPYTLEYGDSVTFENNRFVTTKTEDDITIKLDKAIPSAEYNLQIMNLQCREVSAYDLYFGSDEGDPQHKYDEAKFNKLSKSQKNKIKKTRFRRPLTESTIDIKGNGIKRSVLYLNPDDSLASGKYDFDLNFGYSEEGITEINVHLTNRGIYTFDSLKVIARPTEDFPAKIAKLKENVLTDAEFGKDEFSGSITTDKAKILVLAIPYLKGWEAEIDGAKTELMLANKHYMALEIAPGTHKIELKYNRPLQKAGCVITLAGCLVCAGIVVFEEKRRKIKA